MRRALAELQIEGLTTNVALHVALLQDEDFLAGRFHTRYLEGWAERRALEQARAS